MTGPELPPSGEPPLTPASPPSWARHAADAGASAAEVGRAGPPRRGPEPYAGLVDQWCYCRHPASPFQQRRRCPVRRSSRHRMDGVETTIRRMSSTFSRAGTLASVGASFVSMLPFLQGGNPFGWWFYLLPGLLMILHFAIYLVMQINSGSWYCSAGRPSHETHRAAGCQFDHRLSLCAVIPFWNSLSVCRSYSLMICGLLGVWIVSGICRSSQKSSQ